MADEDLVRSVHKGEADLANLQEANLNGANLQGANMQAAQLLGTNLIDAALSQTQLDNATVDEKAVLDLPPEYTILSGTIFAVGYNAAKEDQFYPLSAAENETLPEIPKQYPAPIETDILDDKVVRVEPSQSRQTDDVKTTHGILRSETLILAERCSGQAKDAEAVLKNCHQALADDLQQTNMIEVGYWLHSLREIVDQVDERDLEDAAGRFHGLLINKATITNDHGSGLIVPTSILEHTKENNRKPTVKQLHGLENFSEALSSLRISVACSMHRC